MEQTYSLLLTVVVSLLLAAPAAAQHAPRPHPDAEHGAVIEERELQPEPGSPTVPGGIHFRRYEDGTLETSGGGTMTHSEGIHPDPARGTYRVETPEETDAWFEWFDSQHFPREGVESYRVPPEGLKPEDVPLGSPLDRPHPQGRPETPDPESQRDQPLRFAVFPPRHGSLLRQVDYPLWGRWKARQVITQGNFFKHTAAFYTVTVIKYNSDGYGGKWLESYADNTVIAPRAPEGWLWYLGQIEQGGVWERWSNREGWQWCHDQVRHYYSPNFVPTKPDWNHLTYVTHRGMVCEADENDPEKYYWYWKTGPGADFLEAWMRLKVTAR